MKEKVPLDCGKRQVFLDMRKIDYDLNEFQRLYRKRSDPDACEQVLELYRGLLFYHNSYDWVAQWEAYYEHRYIEILEHIIKYHERCGNRQTAKLYKRYLEKQKIYQEKDKIQCTLWEFEELYQNKSVSSYEKAQRLFKEILFGGEAYSWIMEEEGHYEMMYLEILESLLKHYQKKKEYNRVAYYQKILKMKGLSDECRES